MYLLYLDDSGSPNDKNSAFFVFAGVAIFERQTHWLDASMTEIAKRFNPLDPQSIEFHAQPMRSGAEGWHAFDPADRVQATVDILELLTDPRLRLKVFAAVVEKSLVTSDLGSFTFEKVACAFDDMLAERYRLHNDKQRGLVIFDESDSERVIQAFSHTLKHIGHAKGKLRNFAEVPLFIDSKASRMIQMADMVAYWIYRRYEAADPRGFNLIAPYFFHSNGKLAGFHEFVSPATAVQLAAPTAEKYPFPKTSGLGVILPSVKPRFP
jgi:hypothetical protein